MDDANGYGTRSGAGDGDEDDVPGGFAGQSPSVIEHPPVDHRGHRTDAKGQCVGCGSAQCMGGCGSGCKRM